MRVLRWSTACGLLFALTFAQKNKNEGEFGKGDFDPSRTQIKNANLPATGDKEPDNSQHLSPNRPGAGPGAIRPNQFNANQFNNAPNQFAGADERPVVQVPPPRFEPSRNAGNAPFEVTSNVPNAPIVVAPNGPSLLQNGPGVVQNGPSVVQNAPTVVQNRNRQLNNGGDLVVPQPGFEVASSVETNPVKFATQFPTIADLDPPNHQQQPSEVRPQVDSNPSHSEAAEPQSEGNAPVATEFPKHTNNGPIIDRRGPNKSPDLLPKSNNHQPQPGGSFDYGAFATSVNAKFTDIISNLSSSNILTREDLANERLVKNISDIFVDLVEKDLRGRAQQNPNANEQAEILQESADKVVQYFRASRKSPNAGINNAELTTEIIDAPTLSPTFGGPVVSLNPKGQNRNSPPSNISPLNGNPNKNNADPTKPSVFNPFNAHESQKSTQPGSSDLDETTETTVVQPNPNEKGVDTEEKAEPGSGVRPHESSPPVLAGTSSFHRNSSVPLLGTESRSNNNQENGGSSENLGVQNQNSQNLNGGSNRTGATVPLGNVPFATVEPVKSNKGKGSSLSNNGKHPIVEATDESALSGNGPSGSESSEISGSRNPEEPTHVFSINRGTIAPGGFRPPFVAAPDTTPGNSKEAPFVVEPQVTTLSPSFVHVNTGTLPPFVISGFHITLPPREPIDSTSSVNHLNVKPSISNTEANFPVEVGHSSGKQVLINGRNATFNQSSSSEVDNKPQPGGFVNRNHNQFPTPQSGLNSNVDNGRNVGSGQAEEPSDESVSTIRSDILIPNNQGQTNPPHRPFDHDLTGAKGFPPLFPLNSTSSAESGSEAFVTGESENEGFTANDNLGHNQPLFPASTAATEHQGHVVPLMPIHTNFTLRNNEFGVSAAPNLFPQPPDWTLTDAPPVVLGSFQTTLEPPNGFFANSTGESREIFPPSANPVNFPGTTESSRDVSQPSFVVSQENETSTSFLNASSSTTGSSIIVVHPGGGNIRTNEPRPEPEPGNSSHSWSNSTSIAPLFPIGSTGTEASHESEYTVDFSNSSSTSTSRPLFPVVIGNEVTRELNSSSPSPFGEPTIPSNFVNETHVYATESTTMFGNVEFGNSSEMTHMFATVSGNDSSTLPSLIGEVSSSSTTFPFETSKLSENSTAEPAPTGTTEKHEPGVEANDTSLRPEPEWTKVTAFGVENSTAEIAATTTAPITSTENKGKAVATWSLKLTDIEWDNALNDKTSWQFKQLHGDIYGELEKIFKELLEARFVDVTIKKFSQGSVIVNGQTDLTEKIDNTRLNDDFEKAIQSRGYQLGSHKVDPSTINVDHPGGSAPQLGAKPIGANGVPGYVIGIIIAAILLAVVVLAVGLLVRRYRTRRLREDHYMVDEETMNGGAVKNWQQQNQRPANGNGVGRDNYASVNMYEMKDTPNSGSSNPANAHTNFGYQNDVRTNGHTAPARHNLAEVSLNDKIIDEASTRH